ncbi:hypothetical protein LINGRAHAP2_LOCUS19483 [Linum grandiflorum]
MPASAASTTEEA